MFVRAANAAARSLGLVVHVVEVRAVTEFEAAFTEMVRARAEALLVIEDSPFSRTPRNSPSLRSIDGFRQ